MLKSLYNRFFDISDLEISNRHNNFNVIRFFAAVMVIYGHMCSLIGIGQFSVMKQAVSGLGVKIFFVISGYLITKSFLSDSNALRYSIKRFFRIMPGLAVIVVLTTFIFGPILTDLSTKEYFANPETYAYLKNILFHPVYTLPGVFGQNPYPYAVNGSLWSLPVEVFMYLLMPLTIVIFRKFNIEKIGMILGFVVSFLLYIYILKFHNDLVIVVWGNSLVSGLSLVPLFYLGSLFTFKKVRNLLNLQWAVAIMVILLLFDYSWFKSEILLTFALPYLIFSFALQSRPVFAKIFSVNDYSYGLYLYGFLIQQIIVRKFGVLGLPLNYYFIVSLAVTFVFAVLSWHLVEKPCQKFSKNLLKKING